MREPNIEIAIKAQGRGVILTRRFYASRAWHWLAAGLARQLGDDRLERELERHGNDARAVGVGGSWAMVRHLHA